MKKTIIATLSLFCLFTFSSIKKVQSTDYQYYWMKVAATDKFQRSFGKLAREKSHATADSDNR